MRDAQSLIPIIFLCRLLALGIPIPKSKAITTTVVETHARQPSSVAAQESIDTTLHLSKRARHDVVDSSEKAGLSPVEDTPQEPLRLDVSTIADTAMVASTLKVMEKISSGLEVGLTKAQRKKRILKLNQQLAALAQRKQLRQAQKVFGKAARKGMVDAHTYSNMMNAHVRCGDIAGAAKV